MATNQQAAQQPIGAQLRVFPIDITKAWHTAIAAAGIAISISTTYAIRLQADS